MEMVRSFEWEIDSDEHDTSHIKHVYLTTFANRKDEVAYSNTPEHQAHIKLGVNYTEGVSAIDYFINK